MLFPFRINKVLTLLSLAAVCLCSSAQARQQTETFTLLPVDGSPHTLEFPVPISKPGSIIVTLTLNFDGLLSEKTVLASLYRTNYRYVLVSKYYDSRARALRVQYEVDKEELATGGEYYLTLTSYSHNRVVNGEVQIEFPVAGEKVYRPGEGPLPNLVVTDIRLDESCKAIVTMKNKGAGELPTYLWKKNMPTLALFKDGELWGEVDIRFFDYQKGLSPAGGEASYNTGLKVIGSAKIKAEIKSNSRVFEEDKNDNSREVMLPCD